MPSTRPWPSSSASAAQPRAACACASSAETQVRDRVALEAVRAALQQDELGLVRAQVRPRPAAHAAWKCGIVGAWRQRQVELGAGGRRRRRFRLRAGAGIEVAAVLVHVGEHQVRIVLEARRTRRRRGARRCRRRRCASCRGGCRSISIATPQSLNTQKPAAWPRDGVMQPGDRNECAARVAAS